MIETRTKIDAGSTRSYRFDVKQLRRMQAAGVFDDQKVELIGGRIYAMTDLPPHVLAVDRFFKTLFLMLPRDKWTVYQEKPLLIDRYWAPKPDVMILRGDDKRYSTRLPVPLDVALLIEVADTSYARDRGRKWRRYAAAGIPAYAIVRLQKAETLVELGTGPAGQGKAAGYQQVVTYRAEGGESMPIVVDGVTVGQVPVADLVVR